MAGPLRPHTLLRLPGLVAQGEAVSGARPRRPEDPQRRCRNADCREVIPPDTHGRFNYCCESCKQHGAYLRRRSTPEDRDRQLRWEAEVEQLEEGLHIPHRPTVRREPPDTEEDIRRWNQRAAEIRHAEAVAEMRGGGLRSSAGLAVEG